MSINTTVRVVTTHDRLRSMCQRYFAVDLEVTERRGEITVANGRRLENDHGLELRGEFSSSVDDDRTFRVGLPDHTTAVFLLPRRVA